MKTYLECIPCFFRQLLEGARIAKLCPKKQKQVIDEFCRLVPDTPLDISPPEIACIGYGILNKIVKNSDPYRAIKRKSNLMALMLFDKLKKRIRQSKDRLLAALEFAICGNIIDFGVKNNLNVADELKKITLGKNKNRFGRRAFHYTEFKKALRRSRKIMYLADNAGEVVFDRLLIEEIKNMYPLMIIYYAVKKSPIINDALFYDAEFCGIDKFACIVSNGSAAPGTVIRLCSAEFKSLYDEADMVISKGQGNFESLTEKKKPVFYLFMVKCPVVAREIGRKVGEKVLFYNLNKKRAS
jgi:damage-control phosphatase, subfamily I